MENEKNEVRKKKRNILLNRKWNVKICIISLCLMYADVAVATAGAGIYVLHKKKNKINKVSQHVGL